MCDTQPDRVVAPPYGIAAIVRTHGAFGLPQPCGRLVPTARFLTALPDCSTGGSQACCILQPTMGFTVFPRGAR
jgi:hypothetical protein